MRMEVRVLLTLLLFGLGSSDKQPEKVQPWMDLLKKFGKNELQKINQKNKENVKSVNGNKFSPINQYLVAAVISRGEFNKVVDESQINKLKNGGRLKFYINKRRKEHGSRKFHGEMIFLHEKGELDGMVTRLREEYEPESEPLVLMYSHYIPCAHVNNLGYSCSEEIGTFSDSLAYPMYIGYTGVYKDTDESQSKTYMSAGNDIQVFRELNEHIWEKVYFTSVNSFQGKTFQHLFKECLFNMGIGTCNNEQEREKYVTKFVNTVVYSCTKNSRNIGKFTEYTRKQFLTCIDGFIDSCNDCSECSRSQYPIVKVVVQFCAGSIVQSDLYLGSVRTIDDNKWPKYRGAWKDLTHPLNPNGIRRLPCRVNNDATLDNCMKKLVDLINEGGDQNKKLSPQQKRIEELTNKLKTTFDTGKAKQLSAGRTKQRKFA